MAHLPEGLGLDLTNTLTSHLELLAYLLEGAAVAIDKAESLLQNLPLAFVEGIQDVLD